MRPDLDHHSRGRPITEELPKRLGRRGDRVLLYARPAGVVCMTGILGGEWELAGFRPMEHIPTGVRLTGYSGGATDIALEDLQRYVSMVERGELEIRRGPVWRFDQLQQAHRAMDENRANGEMVVVIGAGQPGSSASRPYESFPCVDRRPR